MTTTPAPPDSSAASEAVAITVIVPLYQVAAYAAAAVESLRAQHFTDFEALLIDDGATDGSGDIALAAAAGDPRFRLLRQPNRGLSAARNLGLDQARGRYIAFLDGDDRLAPEFLQHLHDALVRLGADWVACAVCDCWPDGRSGRHAGIFGADLADLARQGLRRVPLRDWPDLLAHYPSAWNKLYRRSLIGDLRFPEGTWFEDHAFYQSLALRAGEIAYLPEPLYWQSRGRAGQITASDDERIFQQFTVLEDLRGLMAGSDLGTRDPQGTRAAFAALASRLLAERLPALRDPDRRARYLRQAADFLARHGIGFQPEASPSLAAVLGGQRPVVVVLDAASHPEAEAGPLAESLAAQDIAGFEILVVARAQKAAAALEAMLRERCANATVLPAALAPSGRPSEVWRAALAASTAPFLVVAAPQDSYEPVALRLWVDGALRLGAGMVVSGMRAPALGDWHSGWGDPAMLHEVAPLAAPIDAARGGALALDAGPEGLTPAKGEIPPDPALPAGALILQDGRLLREGQRLRACKGSQPFHPLLAAKMIARAPLEAALPRPDCALPEAGLMAGLAAQADLTLIWMEFPGARPGLRPKRGWARLRQGAAQLAGGNLGRERQILTREIRLDFDFAYERRSPSGRLAALGAVMLARLRLPAALRRASGPLDPQIGARLCRLLGLARAHK